MTPCEELEQDIDLALSVKEKETPSWGRLFLRVIGLEELWDFLFNDKKFDWKVIIDLLILGDFALAVVRFLEMLRLLGLTGAITKLAAKLGPWTIVVWAAIFAIELVVFLRQRSGAQDRFNTEIKRLYETTDCKDRDTILGKRGVSIPN